MTRFSSSKLYFGHFCGNPARKVRDCTCYYEPQWQHYMLQETHNQRISKTDLCTWLLGHHIGTARCREMKCMVGRVLTYTVLPPSVSCVILILQTNLYSVFPATGIIQWSKCSISHLQSNNKQDCLCCWHLGKHAMHLSRQTNQSAVHQYSNQTHHLHCILQ